MIFSSSKTERESPLTLFLITLLFGGLILCYSSEILRVYPKAFNQVRIAPSVAIAWGYPLYGDLTKDPQFWTLYGPIAPLCYLPTTLFHTPEKVLIGGLLISVSMMLFSSFYFLSAFINKEDSISRWIGFSFITFFYFAHPGFRSFVFSIYAEVIAFALTLFAAGAWLRKKEIAAGILAALAVGTKQPYLIWFGIVGIGFLFLQNKSRGVRILISFLLCGFTQWIIAGSLWGFHHLWEHTIHIPLSHPWKSPQCLLESMQWNSLYLRAQSSQEYWQTLLIALRKTFLENGFFGTITLSLIILATLFKPDKNEKSWIFHSLILSLIAWGIICSINMVKIASAENSLFPLTLILASIIALTTLLKNVSPLFTNGIQTIIVALLSFLIFQIALIDDEKGWHFPKHSFVELDAPYRYGWNPLPYWFQNHRAYHLQDVLWSLDNAEIPLSNNLVEQNYPPGEKLAPSPWRPGAKPNESWFPDW